MCSLYQTSRWQYVLVGYTTNPLCTISPQINTVIKHVCTSLLFEISGVTYLSE